MAFSETKKLKIVRVLGYPALSVVADSILYINWVNQRLDNLTSAIESCACDILDRILAIDGKLDKALCRTGIAKIDGITFREGEIARIRKERCRLIKELSQLLDIPENSCGSQGSVCI